MGPPTTLASPSPWGAGGAGGQDHVMSWEGPGCLTFPSPLLCQSKYAKGCILECRARPLPPWGRGQMPCAQPRPTCRGPRFSPLPRLIPRYESPFNQVSPSMTTQGQPTQVPRPQRPGESHWCALQLASLAQLSSLSWYPGAWYFYPYGLQTVHPAVVSWWAAKDSRRQQEVWEPRDTAAHSQVGVWGRVGARRGKLAVCRSQRQGA